DLSNRFRRCLGAAGQTPRMCVTHIIRPALRCGMLALAALFVSSVALADDFPLVGEYTQNVACKGDGTDAESSKVKISTQEIVSNIGVCTILDNNRTGERFFAHV